MKHIFYPEKDRGKNDLGWLKANFSFSFGQYYDPGKMNFGALRVLNDDVIGAGKGFGSHPHDNMEITTIVLKGALEHKDSLGNTGIIKAGDVQVMSAGSGVIHSEYNPSPDEETQSLQIWIYPKIRNIEPRYDQKNFAEVMEQNKLTTLISPVKSDVTLQLNQDTTFSTGSFDADKQINYTTANPSNGSYIFVLEGTVIVDGRELNKRDAIGGYDTDSFTINTKTPARLLIIEVPM